MLHGYKGQTGTGSTFFIKAGWRWAHLDTALNTLQMERGWVRSTSGSTPLFPQFPSQ
jgi:hypothetical protein